MFVDEANIIVVGGDGGNGCLSFRREKFVPRGGPDGGNGGNGGAVILEADHGVSTLLAFRFNTIFRSERGRHGEGSRRTGRSGSDRIVRVPVGTMVFDEERVRLLADLTEPGHRFVAAEGGRGGRGNASFTSSIKRAPTIHNPGTPGRRQTLRLELKLLADVGLLGFPNAGKSTLISRISAARPKIADYPFTTLVPSLGVVDRGDFNSFVVADIPGLIEGAHEGAGLGHRFLRHVERCRLLLHLVDPLTPDRDPVEGIGLLNEELQRYDPDLAGKPQVLAVTKADAGPEPALIDKLRRHAEKQRLPFLVISAVSGEGISDLVSTLGQQLDRLAGTGEPHAGSTDE